MISVNEHYIYCQLLANASQTGANFTPNDYNTYIEPVTHDLIRKYYGLPELYRPANPSPPISYEITQLVTDYLNEIKVPLTTFLVDSQGRLLKPSDYLHHSLFQYDSYEQAISGSVSTVVCCDSCQTDCNHPNKVSVTKKYKGGKKGYLLPLVRYKEVKVVTDGEWALYLNDPIRFPTKEYPIAKFDNTYIQFAPYDLKVVNWSYIRYPKKPKWNYNISQGEATFNATGSQDIELPKILMTELAMALLDRLGFNTREYAMVQYADNKRNTGN